MPARVPHVLSASPSWSCWHPALHASVRAPSGARPGSSRSPVRSVFPRRHRRSACSSPRSPPTTGSPARGWRASSRTRAASCGSAPAEGSTASTATRSGTSVRSATTARRSATTTSTSSPRIATASSGSAPALASAATTARTRASALSRSTVSGRCSPCCTRRTAASGSASTTASIDSTGRTGRRTRYSGSATVVGKTIQVITEDRRGHLWIGTKESGVVDLDRRERKRARLSRLPRCRERTARRRHPRDHRGRVGDDVGRHVPRRHGAHRSVHRKRDALPARPEQPAQPEPQRRPDDVARAGRDGLWVALENGGLDRFDIASGTFQHNVYDPNNPTGLNNNSIWAVLEDHAGTLWTGTFAGGINVAKRNSEAIRTYRSVPGDESSLSVNSVLGFSQDSTGSVWVATDGGGVNRFDVATGRFSRFTSKTSALQRRRRARGGGRGQRCRVARHVGRRRHALRSAAPTPSPTFTSKNSNLPGRQHLRHARRPAEGRVWIGSGAKDCCCSTARRGRSPSSRSRETRRRSRRSGPSTELRDGRLALGSRESGLIIFDPETRHDDRRSRRT